MSTQTTEQMIDSTGQRPLSGSPRAVSPGDDRQASGFGPDGLSGESVDELVDGPWLDAVLAKADQQGLRLTGEGGFLPALVKAVLERGLAAELSDHLGYAKGDPAGRGAPNSRMGRRYPGAVGVWERAWERFTPFLAFPPEVRRVIYTTNAIESLNYQLRKIIKNRGHFPNDDAVVKLLWLAIRDIEDKRARARAKQRGKKRNERTAPARLVEGATIQGWKQVLNALAITYPDRLPEHLN